MPFLAAVVLAVIGISAFEVAERMDKKRTVARWRLYGLSGLAFGGVFILFAFHFL